MSEQPQEKKIIVDEDWKEQAQREKEMLAAALEREEKEKHLPPAEASFALLATSLATQAMMALGDLENPITRKRETHLGEAKFHIDMLEMLEKKTKGNLAPEEAKLLEGLLFDLRLRYVEKPK